MYIPHPLTPDQANLYVALRREMLLDSPWSFGASPEHDKGSDIDHMHKSLARPDFAVLAVIQNGRAIAAAGVRRDDATKRSHVALIWGVYVTPASRGQGLGRAVVSAAIEVARGWSGIDCVQLSVSKNAPAAQQLYESLGFEVWGIEPDAWRVNGVSYAEVHMRKTFDPSIAT